MISLIVAIDKNGLIGNSSGLPWHYPKDLKYFKETTKDSIVVMGRETYETIGKLLPGRVNVIISSKNLDIPKAIVYNDIDRLMQSFKAPANVFVIGGAQIYGQTIRYVDRLYITRIDAEHEGDIYFPEIKWQQFKKISEERKGILTFEVYERI